MITNNDQTEKVMEKPVTYIKWLDICFLYVKFEPNCFIYKCVMVIFILTNQIAESDHMTNQRQTTLNKQHSMPTNHFCLFSIKSIQ